MTAADIAWEDPPRLPAQSGAPVLSVHGFEGSLDWLLELARAERVDLRKVSIRALIDAFVDALDAALAQPGAHLSRWGEFLAMAAQLTLLRSRLLLPPEAAEAKTAQAEAEALRRQLLEGDAMRRGAAWLEARRQLGRDVFGRGVSAAEREASLRVADITDLFRACLVALRVPDLANNYRPPLPPLWRVRDAAARITRLLSVGVAGELGVFLPKLPRGGSDYDLQCRAAVASTLVAGLELARAGELGLEQPEPWRDIRVRTASCRPATPIPAARN